MRACALVRILPVATAVVAGGLIALSAAAGPRLPPGPPDPIVLGAPRASASGAALWPSVLAGAGALGLAGSAWVIWRRTDRPDPAEAAFRRMSRLLGLSASERRLLRAIASAYGGASPVALLLSAHALQEACSRFENGRRRPSFARLLRKLAPAE